MVHEARYKTIYYPDRSSSIRLCVEDLDWHELGMPFSAWESIAHALIKQRSEQAWSYEDPSHDHLKSHIDLVFERGIVFVKLRGFGEFIRGDRDYVFNASKLKEVLERKIPKRRVMVTCWDLRCKTCGKMAGLDEPNGDASFAKLAENIQDLKTLFESADRLREAGVLVLSPLLEHEELAAKFLWWHFGHEIEAVSENPSVEPVPIRQKRSPSKSFRLLITVKEMGIPGFLAATRVKEFCQQYALTWDQVSEMLDAGHVQVRDEILWLVDAPC